MDIFKTAIEWTGILGGLGLLAYGLPFAIYTFFVDDDSYDFKLWQWIASALCIAWALVFSVAGIVWLIRLDEKTQIDNHSWRGGGGSETTCKYEQRWVGVAGKGGHMETWTVCR